MDKIVKSLPYLSIEIIKRKKILKQFIMKIIKSVSFVAFAFAVIMLNSCQSGSNQAKNGKELFGKYFSAYSDEATSPLRGEGGGDEALREILTKGMTDYSSKNFAGAITNFEAYLAQRPNNLQVPFYLGISYLGVENVDKAEARFMGMLEKPDALYYEHSQWYLALISMYKGQLLRSKGFLEQIIANKNHYYKEQAEDLVNQVDYMIEHGVSE
jgi:hypothetical protein